MINLAKKVKKEYSWCYVELPKNIKKQLLQFGKEIEKDDLFVEEADKGLEKNSHITIKYALMTNDLKDIKNVLGKQKYGNIYLGKSSIFEKDEYDVIKIDVESKDLERLHYTLNNLPHADKYPEYKAHATIAYVKKGCGKKYIGQFKINKEFRFREIYFGDIDKKDHKINLYANFCSQLSKKRWTRLAIFNKELFCFSDVRGEWFIVDGTALFADGDIGDMNHDAYVIDHLRRKYAYDEFDRMEYVDWDGFEQYLIKEYLEDSDNDKNLDEKQILNKCLKDLGMSEAEIEIARGGGDPRFYGIKDLGWKRVNGNNIETWNLEAKDLSDIADGLSDIDDPEELEKETFNIEVGSSRIIYEDVPLSVIDSNNPVELLPYRRQY